MAELAKLVQYVEEAINSTVDARALAERDSDYYHHKQLTASQISEYKKRKQPPVQRNRVKPKVDFLLGMERQTRTDPKAYPRTPVHEKDADAATDAIRYVCDNNTFNGIRSAVFENMLIEGTGACEVVVKNGPKGMEIEIKHIPWDRQIVDPYSRRLDCSDAKYKGAHIWMDYDDAIQIAPKELVDASLSDFSDTNDTYEDRPRIRWADPKRKRVRLVLLYYKEDQWNWCLFVKAGKIKGGVSPYLDEDGNPECPLEFQSAFIDRDGNRYGAVRTMIDVQDIINFSASKALHLMSQRQTYGTKSAVPDARLLKRELAKPDGHVELRDGVEFGKQFGVIPTNDMLQGNLLFLEEAKAELDAIGANAALSGKEERNLSGRALIARQQSGQMELGPLFDSLRLWQRRVYRQVWNRIRQYWTEERWIRVTDDQENMRWVGLNVPIRLGEQIEQQFGVVPPEFQGDPRLMSVVGMRNNLAELDVDLVVEEAPDTTTIQQEQFELITSLYQANPQAIPFDAIVEMMPSLRNKKAVLEKIKGDEEQQRAMAEQQQEAAQIAKAKEVAEIEKDQSQAEKNRASAAKDLASIAMGAV